MVSREVNECFWTPEAFTLFGAKTAGNESPKVSMLRGFVLVRSLRGKPFTFDLRGSSGCGCEVHSGLIGVVAKAVWAILV